MKNKDSYKALKEDRDCLKQELLTLAKSIDSPESRAVILKYFTPKPKRETKVCTLCLVEKSVSEFSIRKKKYLNPRCKKCLKDTRHPLVDTWGNMKTRCYKKHGEDYPNYGGRGISVCKEWQSYKPFEEWALFNGWAKGLQLDRIDNDGNYEPSNCRWATIKENARNKRNTIFITYNGETKPLREWMEITGVPKTTVYSRHREGWLPEYLFSKEAVWYNRRKLNQ